MTRRHLAIVLTISGLILGGFAAPSYGQGSCQVGQAVIIAVNFVLSLFGVQTGLRSGAIPREIQPGRGPLSSLRELPAHAPTRSQPAVP